MLEVGLDLSGLKDLIKETDKLEAKVRRKVVGKAVQPAARILRKEARRRCPISNVDEAHGHLPGNLKKSITVKKVKRSKIGMYVVGPEVGPGAKYDGFYGNFVERGTSKTKAHPFFQWAFEAKKKEMINSIGNELTKALYG